MIKKSILQVATYPIEEPIHGGQKRSAALYSYYTNIFHSAKFVGIIYEKNTTKFGSNDIVLQDERLIAEIEKKPYLEDILLGEAIYNDSSVKEKMRSLLLSYRPDIIQIEQGYPYAGLKKLLKELKLQPKLIFSTHNVEYKMKEEIYRNLSVPKTEQEKYVEQIKQLETGLAKQSDFIIAVSNSDATAFKSLGGRPVVVAPNGITKQIPTEAALKHWKTFKKKHGYTQLVTFVGSAHLPNLTGLLEAVGKDLSYFPPHARLMLAGGVSQYLQGEIDQKKLRNNVFWNHAEPLGILSDDNLAALIALSDVIILPILSGGGSNLKTAEAILSDRKVVATTTAFRSFEQFNVLPNIYMVEEPEKFKETLLHALEEPLIPRTHSQNRLANQVQWDYAFKNLRNILPRNVLSPFAYLVFRISEAGKLGVRRVAKFVLK